MDSSPIFASTLVSRPICPLEVSPGSSSHDSTQFRLAPGQMDLRKNIYRDKSPSASLPARDIILTTSSIMTSERRPDSAPQGWSEDGDGSSIPTVPGYHLSKRPRHHSISGGECQPSARKSDGTSFFFRNPTPAAIQRSDQACDKCRERKTKVRTHYNPTLHRRLTFGFAKIVLW